MFPLNKNITNAIANNFNKGENYSSITKRYKYITLTCAKMILTNYELLQLKCCNSTINKVQQLIIIYIKYTNIKMPYLERNSLNSNIITLVARFRYSKVLSSLVHEFSKLTPNFCHSNLKSCVCAQKQNDQSCKTYALWLDLIGSDCL